MDSIVNQDYTELESAKEIFSKAILQRNKLGNIISCAKEMKSLKITPNEWDHEIKVNKIHKLFKTRKYKLFLFKRTLKELTTKSIDDIFCGFDNENNLLNQRINFYFNKWKDETKS